MHGPPAAWSSASFRTSLGPGTADSLLAAIESFAGFPLGTGGGRVEFLEVRQRGTRNRVIDVGTGEPQQGQCRIDIETPAWLAHKGLLLNPDALDFPTLFRHAYRRLTTLAALYGELSPDTASAFRELDKLAAGVHTADRHLRALHSQRLTLERVVS